MKDLPRDSRGLPITYTSLSKDGRYDFTRADHYKWLHCARERLCGLCGHKLDRKIWFIGGPMTMVNRYFFDLGMHEECARYALLVCPYLAVKSFTGVKKRRIDSSEIAAEWEIASSNRTKPVAFGLACTDGYEPCDLQGDLVVRAKRWIRPLEWWDAGKPAPAQELPPPTSVAASPATLPKVPHSALG